jgi:hypothetical protein
LHEHRARLCHFRNVGFMARLVCFRKHLPGRLHMISGKITVCAPIAIGPRL